MPSFTPLTLTLMVYPTLLAPGAYADGPANDEAEAEPESTLTPPGAEPQQPDDTPTVTQSAKPRSLVSRWLRLDF